MTSVPEWDQPWENAPPEERLKGTHLLNENDQYALYLQWKGQLDHEAYTRNDKPIILLCDLDGGRKPSKKEKIPSSAQEIVASLGNEEETQESWEKLLPTLPRPLSRFHFLRNADLNEFPSQEKEAIGDLTSAIAHTFPSIALQSMEDGENFLGSRWKEQLIEIHKPRWMWDADLVPIIRNAPRELFASKLEAAQLDGFSNHYIANMRFTGDTVNLRDISSIQTLQGLEQRMDYVTAHSKDYNVPKNENQKWFGLNKLYPDPQERHQRILQFQENFTEELKKAHDCNEAARAWLRQLAKSPAQEIQSEKRENIRETLEGEQG